MKYGKTNVLRLASIVQRRIQEEKSFDPWHNLLISFSGGQDSALCLLVLYLLKDQSRLTWNRKKLISFSKQHKSKGTIIEQALTQPLLRPNEVWIAKGEQNRNFCFSFATKKGAQLIKKLAICPKQSFAIQETAGLDRNLTTILVLQKKGGNKNVTKTEGAHPKPRFASQTKFGMQAKTKLCFVKRLTSSTFEKPFLQVTEARFLKDFEETIDLKKVSYLTTSLVNSYLLLWCNHFWQKRFFFYDGACVKTKFLQKLRDLSVPSSKKGFVRTKRT